MSSLPVQFAPQPYPPPAPFLYSCWPPLAPIGGEGSWVRGHVTPSIRTVRLFPLLTRTAVTAPRPPCLARAGTRTRARARARYRARARIRRQLQRAMATPATEWWCEQVEWRQYSRHTCDDSKNQQRSGAKKPASRLSPVPLCVTVSLVAAVSGSHNSPGRNVSYAASVQIVCGVCFGRTAAR